MNPHSLAAAIEAWLKWHTGHPGPHTHTADDWAYALTVSRQLVTTIRQASIIYFDDPIVNHGLCLLNTLYKGANVIRATSKKTHLVGRLASFNKAEKRSDELLKSYRADIGGLRPVSEIMEDLNKRREQQLASL